MNISLVGIIVNVMNSKIANKFFWIKTNEYSNLKKVGGVLYTLFKYVTIPILNIKLKFIEKIKSRIYNKQIKFKYR